MQNKTGKTKENGKQPNCVACWKKLLCWICVPIIWAYRLAPIEKFTGVLCIFAGIQCLLFIESERPFVGISNISFAGNELKAGVPLAFIIETKNSGKTTAFVIDSRTLTRTQDNPNLVRGLRKSLKETIAKGPILAGDTNRLVSRTIDENGQAVILGQGAVDQLTNGTHHLWVIGYIAYTDRFPIFGSTRTTGYCFIYNPRPADSREGPFDRCGDEEYEYAN